MMIFIGAIIVILDNESSHTERLIDELCQDVDTDNDIDLHRGNYSESR